MPTGEYTEGTATTIALYDVDNKCSYALNIIYLLVSR
jgi:hypothetical protein